MSKLKTKPVREAKMILLTILDDDREPLDYFEAKIAWDRCHNDLLRVRDAEIVRKTLHLAYASEKRKRS
jgi:hypothetical protein